MQRRQIAHLAAALLLAGASPLVAAQDKLLRIVIPYSAGGLTDVITRTIAPSIGKQINRSVVVENKPGAASLIATKAVQAAPADGNITVMVQNIGFVGLPYTNKSATYDPLKDFIPVAAIADGPAYIYVHSDVPAKSLAEFIAYAKSSPTALEAATSGPGGGSHMWTELLSRRAGIKLLPVPYKGSAEMTTALITGEAKVLISSATEPLNAQVRAGKLRILGVASEQRSPLTPDVPLVAETVPGFHVAGWFGLLAAPNTPAADVTALANAVKVALNEPGVKERYAALFLENKYMGPQEFAGALVKTNEFYKKLVADLNITPQ